MHAARELNTVTRRWLAPIGAWLLLCGLLGPLAAPEAWGKGAARVEPLTEDGLPNVQATYAVVMDAASGAELYSKSGDTSAGIASTTKIFVAMVVRRRNINLGGVTEILREDTRYAIGGARTRLEIRHSFKNIDLLRAMLVVSDNRAPTALGRAVGLTPDGLVQAMNRLAKELGLRHTMFTDPSGLRGNVSTAREMAVAFREALRDPLLAEIMGTREVTIRSIHSRPQVIYYRNTNRALHSDKYKVSGGKTGYTKAAGYCLVIAARVVGRDLIMVFLDTKEELTRFGDFGRVVSWLEERGMPPLDSRPILTGKSSVIRATAAGTGAL